MTVKRLLIFFAAIMLLTISAVAQTTTPPKSAAPQPTPEPSEEETEKLVQRWEAREKDVRRALRLSEPEKRLVALKKLLTDYPEDAEVPKIVDEGILDTYLKYWPQQQEQILAQIDRMLKRVPENFKADSGNSLYSQVAAKLVEAGILLDKAEELAAKGLAAFDVNEFVLSQKRIAENRARLIALNKNAAAVLKTDSLTEEEMLKLAPTERAKALTTLGRVYLRKGKTAEAERLLKEAYSANPDINEANIALAEISLSKGESTAVVDYLSSVAVRIPLRPELRHQLETAYRKSHQGALTGLEEMLDAKYRLLMPNPIKVAPYNPTPSRTDRLVLAEVFTGAGCVPCVGADLAFEAARERYSDKNVVLLMYHLHRPLPDPMVNSAALSRSAFYAIDRTPTFIIDGEKDTKGGALREKASLVYDRIEPVIEKRLETAAEAELKLQAALEGAYVKVSATVAKVKSESKSLRLRIALVEDELRYSGENLVRIHPMVVRSLAGLKGGFAVNRSGPTSVEYTFDLKKISSELKSYLDDYEVNGDYGLITFKEKKDKIDGKHLSVVAFVQDEISKKVLQSVYLKVKTETMADK
jgi:tetratricopeptide (TPR) repeat protein